LAIDTAIEVTWPKRGNTAKQRVEAGQQVMTAADMKGHLRRYHSMPKNGKADQVVMFDELRVGTGFPSVHGSLTRRYSELLASGKGSDDQRSKAAQWLDEHGDTLKENPQSYIDFYVFHLTRTRKYRRIGYEVKVSRADFKAEVARPWKRAPAMTVCNTFYFAVPDGLVTLDEVPKDCGLVTVSPTGKVTRRRNAPWNDIDPMPLSFIASIARHRS
jgi:hypothetical protein